MKLLEALRPSDIVPTQLLASIKARRFSALARLFAADTDFQAWTPSGHWMAAEGRIAARIIEVWFTPGAHSTINFTNITSGGRGVSVLECEVAWGVPVQPRAKMTQTPPDEPRVLRQVYVLRVKGGKITEARVYCAGLHTTFPDVDLDKRRRERGLAPRPPVSSARNGTTVQPARAPQEGSGTA